jgi:hypothetical protein
MPASATSDRARLVGRIARQSAIRGLWWFSGRLTALEVSRDDPWRVRELPFGLWRLRRRVCRALERIEEAS